MAQTPASSTTLYCPVADFLNRCDVRTVQQLAADDDIPVATGSLATNGKVLAAIGDACGYIESAAFIGGKYSKEDLEALAGTDCHARSLLYRLVADLAQIFMMERRPDLNLQPTIGMKRTMEFTEQLWEGKRIFPFAEAAAAGRLDSEIETEDHVEERALATYTARRFFGTRNNRWPT
jgi:hypothetical protein